MAEVNVPVCPTHGALPRALHSESFQGIVEVIEEIIGTVSGVGTVSYSRCPYGYPWNFEGVVRALEDLNTSISGISGGGGLTISAGSGIYLSDGGTRINLNAVGTGSVTVLYSGVTAIISGTDTQGGGGGGGSSVTVATDPGTGYSTGSLWFDTNEGRLFVYASGSAVSQPAWYQTNAEAIASKGETPPSGTGLNAPPRDGSIWFNSLMGSLFVYDATTSGWYETGPSRSFAYGPAAPPPSTQGAGWYDSANNSLRVWDGNQWVQV